MATEVVFWNNPLALLIAVIFAFVMAYVIGRYWSKPTIHEDDD